MELADLHMHEEELEFLKKYFEFTQTTYENGACFFTTDLEKITFKRSYKFDVPELEVGTPLSKYKVTAQIIQTQKPISVRLESEVYGVRILSHGGPVFNQDNSKVIGTWFLFLPRRHKVMDAFKTFAPIICEIMPEGACLNISDKEKCIAHQGSVKFNNSKIYVNKPIKQGSGMAEAIRQKKQVISELDASVFGIPVRTIASPIIDEETGEVVGSFNLAIPRKLANDLKELASSLNQGLTGVSAAVEQITSSTNDVSNSQSKLHDEIQKVKGQLDEINNVMVFIKEIADETKMLGLNAAIEAARVGEVGAGFGVVAEEIRKLSAESKNTVAQIKGLTEEIDKSMNETAGASQSTLAVVEQTSAAVQEVNATIEEMTSLANHLTQTAADL